MRENKRGWSIKGKDFIFGEKKKKKWGGRRYKERRENWGVEREREVYRVFFFYTFLFDI